MSIDSNSVLTGTITDLARAGSGIAKLETGEVVFIPFTAPGDEVSFRITKKNKNYSIGQLVEVLKPSPQRVKPPCPEFTKCGGCTWQHLPYSLQFETKQKGVLTALKRAGFANSADHPLPSFDSFPAEKTYEYRNRIQLRGDIKQQLFGFYERETNKIVAINHCVIAEPKINEALAATKAKALSNQSISKDGISKVEISLNQDGELQTYWNQKHAAGGFSQVHSEQNEVLKKWVAENAVPEAGNKKNILLDLFGGNGNLSSGLTENFTEIHCVDLGAPRQPLTDSPRNYHFHQSSITTWLKKFDLSQFNGKNVTVIFDPPREGLSADINAILVAFKKLNVVKIIFVGCDPDSFARDIFGFTKLGFKVKKLAALDLFPQTPHIESLALLLP